MVDLQQSALIAATITSVVGIIASIILICWEIINYKIHTNIYYHDKNGKTITKCLSGLIISLAVADILSNIGFGVSFWNPNPEVCRWQAIETEYIQLSSVLWTGAISLFHLLHVYLLDVSSYSSAARKSRIFFWGACVVCWLVPLAPALWMLESDNHSTKGHPWCWIDVSHLNWVYLFYGPLLIVTVGNFIVWIICGSKLSGSNPVMRLMLGYSIAFVLTWTIPIARRGYCEWFQTCSEDTKEKLIIAHSVTVPLQGFFNLIVYGFCRKLAHIEAAPPVVVNEATPLTHVSHM